MSRFALFPRLIPFVLALVFSLILLPEPVPADTVTEERSVVFSHGDDRTYPHRTGHLLGGWIEYEVFIQMVDRENIYETYHYKTEIVLQYEECDVTPGSTADLAFTLTTFDGEGPEFEHEVGAYFGLDLGIWNPSFQHGINAEVDYVPPMPGDYIHIQEPFTNIAGWGKTCLIDAVLGAVSVYEKGAYPIPLWLDITYPNDPNLVRFADNGMNNIRLEFVGTSDNEGVAGATLEVLAWYGDITIEASTSYSVEEWGMVGPGGGITLLECLPKNSWSEDFYGFPLLGPMSTSLDVDPEESETLTYELRSKVCLPGGGGRQDLVHDTFRIDETGEPASGRPVMGQPDRLRTVIRNLHGGICSGYSSLGVTWYVNEGGDDIPVGTTTLDAADPALADFNSGLADNVTVDFTYAPGNPAYIFTPDHQWPTTSRFASYRAVITPVPLAACPDWFVTSSVGGLTANDGCTLTYQTPLPDFGLTHMHYEGRGDAHPDSMLVFDITARNMGADWPPGPMVVMRDSVFVEARMAFQRRIGINWQDTYITDLTPQLITPLASGGETTVTFTYTVPPESFLQTFQPDRLEARFSINGGNVPGAWRVWESSFGDNTAVTILPVTDLPDRAWPSGLLYGDGMLIEPCYPLVIHHETCPQPVYLYVNDEKLSPGTPAPELLVEVGAGPQGSAPTEGEWEWTPAFEIGDMLDAHERWYKVFEADLCVIAPQPGARSYAFRTTFDWQDEDPHYLYVDRTGAGPESTGNQGFVPSLVGLLTDSELSDVPDGAAPLAGLDLRARPNPFNPATGIHYVLPRASRVVVSIHDARGRQIVGRNLGRQESGPQVFRWDGRDERGRELATGVYFCRVEADGVTDMIKVALIR